MAEYPRRGGEGSVEIFLTHRLQHESRKISAWNFTTFANTVYYSILSILFLSMTIQYIVILKNLYCTGPHFALEGPDGKGRAGKVCNDVLTKLG